MSDDAEKSRKVARVAFEAALGAPNRGATAGRTSGRSTARADDAIGQLIETFEAAAQVDEDGIEFWYARDLQTLLGYSQWRSFMDAIEKAKGTCREVGQEVSDHFADVRKMVPIGSGAEREVEDLKLTRYACYLTAQNGDSRKRPIAFAQTYFAIQTRKQELSGNNENNYSELNEDQKRVFLREEIKKHNKNLASAAKNAGVIEPIDFAVFQNFGYKGLYGGLDKVGIQYRKGLSSKQNILDHMGSTELAANLFRATQTEEKIRREKISGKQNANQAHFEVGRKVRNAIKDIGGDMPETLPAEEDISKVAKRLRRLTKKSDGNR